LNINNVGIGMEFGGKKKGLVVIWGTKMGCSVE
jgi:hypothetical protein